MLFLIHLLIPSFLTRTYNCNLPNVVHVYCVFVTELLCLRIFQNHLCLYILAQGKRKKKKPKVVLDEEGNPKTGKKSKKQFISKPNPNFVKGGGTGPGSKNSVASPPSIKPEPSSISTLRKKPVTKSDGQVVYSKFDFISEDKHYLKKVKPKPSELLKSAEKTENKISRLESSGKKSEAVLVAETQKWKTALQRADGNKVRDDPSLLKKSIKKQLKIKQVS